MPRWNFVGTWSRESPKEESMSKLTTTGVLVRLKAGCYWRSKTTGDVLTGPKGKAGSKSYQPGSGNFRVPDAVWQRQAELPDGQRIMELAE